MKKIIYIFIASVLLFGLFQLISKNPQPAGVSDNDAQLIFFWGEGCPHCETVKTYIKDKNLESQVKISYKEVYNNQENKKLLAETVKKCPEIDTSQGIGVPLAYDTQGNKCLYGDQPIIDWLQPKVLQ